MRIVTLSKLQIYELVSKNSYKTDPKTKFLSRCIDDRYQNDINLSPLALPGADAGELAILFTAANEFGFELIEEKAYQVLIDVVGGVKNLHFHTSKRQELDPIGGCSHFQQFSLHPEAYHLEKEQIEFIKIKVKNSVILGAEDEVLAGDHLRGAVLQIRGNYGVYPAYAIEIKDGRERVGFFEYHETLVGERHKVLAKKLVQEHAVKLYQGCDEEYLYEALCEITDEHFFETVRRLGKGIPLYSVIFNNDGSFIIKDRGLV